MNISCPVRLLGIFIGYVSAGAMDEHLCGCLSVALATSLALQQLLGWQTRAGGEHSRVAGAAGVPWPGFYQFQHTRAPPFTM